MVKEQKDLDRKIKIRLFLVAYSIYVFVFFIIHLPYFHDNTWTKTLLDIARVILWGACFIISITISKRKIFQSRAVKFLLAGYCFLILWGLSTTFFELSLARGWNSYIECSILALFIHTIYMLVRIIEVYDLKRQVVGITILILGAVLLYAFIAYFQDFALLSALSNMFKSRSYRYGYGLGNVNEAARLYATFLVYTFVYMAIPNKNYSMHKIKNSYKVALIALFSVASIMLISSGSRATVSALILFYLVYLITRYYARTKIYIKAKQILALCAVFCAVILIDWQGLFDYFMGARGVNYEKSLPFLTSRNLWLVGVGFLNQTQINEFTGTRGGLMDSGYLYVLLRTGWVGFAIFFGTLFIFAFSYFRNIRQMTKLHCLIGGIIAFVLYYSLLEGGMFWGSSPFTILNWIFIISCMNEKTHNASIKHSVA